MLVQADKLVGGSDAVLVIDDTAVPKKGKHSVGVAWQYASALGKNANCQTLVSLTFARDEVPVMVGLRLFLPESWTSDLARLKRAGIPVEYRTARTKPEIALAEIDRVIATGVRFACVLADAGYGLSAPFRQASRHAILLGRSVMSPTRATPPGNGPEQTHVDRGTPSGDEGYCAGSAHAVGKQTRSLKKLEKAVSRCHRHRLNAACIRGRTGRDSMTCSFGRITKAVTAAWVTGVACFALSGAASAADDEAQIRALEDRFAAAVNAADVDAIMKVYVSDESLVVFDLVPPRDNIWEPTHIGRIGWIS